MKILDLTNLDENGTSEDIASMLEKAIVNSRFVAGVCVYPRYVEMVAAIIRNSGADLEIVTVGNFPHGVYSPETVAKEAEEAARNGATEFDVVINWELFNISQGKHGVKEIVEAARANFPGILKVILETGSLNPVYWHIAARQALDAGADFLKTSTGKVETGATLAAVAELVKASLAFRNDTGKLPGIKVSGGVKTAEMVAHYLNAVMPLTNAPDKSNFRVGVGPASKVLDAWTAKAA